MRRVSAIGLCWSALSLTCMFLALEGNAQTVKSSILGTIRDASGAVIPGVNVSATNVATNVVRATTTDETGNYVVPLLDPGVYRVTAEAVGFKRSVEPGAVLDSATQLRVDLELPVGDVSEQVEVRAAVPLVETDTTSVGTVVKQEEISRLPLLTRNYQSLARLVPTATEPIPNVTGGFQGSLLTGTTWYQVGGTRGADVSYSIDGVDSNQALLQTQSLIPSLDTIQEFKLQTHTFSAEYGRGAVQFITTTKSGTNQLHGSLYEYNQNAAFNANGFFENRAGIEKTPYNLNQFGATVGGPVYMPGIVNGRDKSFFFLGYEGRRFRQNSTTFARFPSQAELGGDFSARSGLIYDPATTMETEDGVTRDPFPNNRIPAERISTAGAAAGDFFAAPNAQEGTLPGNFNTLGAVPKRSDVNSWNIRFDHNASIRDALYFRYTQSIEDLTQGSLSPLSGEIRGNRGRNAMVGYTRTLSPRLVNEFRAAYNRGVLQTLQEGGSAGCLSGPCDSIDYVNDVFQFENISGDNTTWGIPSYTLVGEGTFGGPSEGPGEAITNTYQISDNLVAQLGSHTLKMGFDVRQQRLSAALGGSFVRGLFTFNGQYSDLPGIAGSGNSTADMLLGNANLVLASIGQFKGSGQSTSYGYFLQDDWRVTSKLTMNLGLRYDYFSPWTEKTGKAVRFDEGAPPGSCFEDTNPCPPAALVPATPGEPYYTPDRNNFGPRIGLAYSPFGNNRTVIRSAYGVFYSDVPAIDRLNSFTNPPSSVVLVLVPQNPRTDLDTTNTSKLFPAAPVTRDDFPLYTGSPWAIPAGTSLNTVRQNAPQQIYHQWQFTLQREIIPNLLVEVGYIGGHGYNGNRRKDYNQAHLDAPGKTSGVSARRPYPQLGRITTMEQSAHNTYNAGTLRVERRFASGFSFNTAYTFSKKLDDFGDINDPSGILPQNSYDTSLDKAVSSNDATHRLSLSFAWELPIGRGRALGTGMNRVLDGIVGGWEVAGIAVFQSGFPVNVLPSRDWSNTGSASPRPNHVGEINYLDPRETDLLWADLSEAFENPALGSFGNSARNAARAPGFNNWDLTIAKRFRLAEQATLQLRAEFSNAFNHTQFGSVAQRLGQPTLGYITSARAARSIQFAARIEF